MSSREFKDGPMACARGDTTSFLDELRFGMGICQEFLQEHVATFSDTPWQSKDGEGQEPRSDFEKASLKLANEIVYQNDKLIFPPPFTRLSDELVYMATKLLKNSERGERYPYDFLPRGDIHPDRVPSGVGPLVWAHGLPFFPVYKGYYILTGRQHADWIGWHLQPKSFQQMKAWPIWTIGPVVAPGSAVELPRTIKKQSHLWKVVSARNCERGQEKNAAARDVVSKAHQHLAIVPDEEDGFTLTQIYHLTGYHVRVGPNLPNGSRADIIPRSFFSKNRVTGFDYDTCINRPYRNNQNPRIYNEDDEEEDEEEGNDEKEEDGEGDQTEDQGLSDSDDGKSVTHGDTTETEDVHSSQQAAEVTTPRADDMEIEQSQAIAKDDGESRTADDVMDTDDAHATDKEEENVKPSGDAMDTDDAQETTKGDGGVRSQDDTMDTGNDQADSKDEKVAGDTDAQNDEVKVENSQADKKEEGAKAPDDAMETEDMAAIHTKNEDPQAHDVPIKIEDTQITAKEEDGVEAHGNPRALRTGYLKFVPIEKVETSGSKEIFSTPPTTAQGDNECEVPELKDLTTTTESIKADNASIHDTPMTEASIKIEGQTEDAEPVTKTE